MDTEQSDAARRETDFKRKRAKRAIIASQKTRRNARLAQIPRRAKNACWE
jgi:hypothetical protein